MVLLKRIGVLSLAKIYAVLMAITGLILGVIVAVMGLIAGQASEGLYQVSPKIGLVGIILFPILYGIAGFIIGALTAWLFNLAAKYFGGLELELDKK